MQLKFRHRAEPNERFAPTCFDARIGDHWPIQLSSGRRIPAKLIAAEVAPDGTSVEFTIDVEAERGDRRQEIERLFRFEAPQQSLSPSPDE